MTVYPDSKLPPVAQEFLDTVLSKPYPHVYAFKDKVYGGMHPFIKTDNLHLVRNQVLLGEIKKNRFEPSHALSHYLTANDVKNIENLSIYDERAKEYLRGNTINTEKSRSWVLVAIENIPLGWGKESNGVLKNHYPKGLRIKY